MLTLKSGEIVSGSTPMNEEELRVLYACKWMVDNKTTIRIAAAKFGYPSTTFWRRIHKECRELSPDLYKKVSRQMRVNLKRHKRRKQT